MLPVNQALNEVKDLFEKVVGKPAPEIPPASYASFPPGVDPLHHAMHEVHELKRLNDQAALAAKPAAWTPLADSFTTKDAYLVRMEIPGVDRKTLKVLVDGPECIVRGERKAPEITPDLQPMNVERAWGSFERRFVLPPGSHPDKVTAHYEDGVLDLKVVFEGKGTPKEMKVEVS